MSDVEIRPVKTSRELNQFVKVPWTVYKSDPLWIPPLISEVKKLLTPGKNPFWDHADCSLFIAYKNGKPVGRVAAIVNENHNITHKDKVGFFGFFESTSDYGVAEILLKEAEAWLKDKGMDTMRGPFNPSINDDLGLLLEGEKKPPVFMMPYNPGYYLTFMEKYGLRKVRDLYAWYVDNKMHMPEKVARIAERSLKRTGAVIRELKLDDFDAELAKVREVYNSAWEKNWGAVAMTRAEFDHLAADFKQIIFPELALLAEIDGKPVGFSLAVPDMNNVLGALNGRLLPFGALKMIGWRKKIKGMRIIIMGVIEKYRRRGIETNFYLECYKRGMALNMQYAEMSWILEENKEMNQALETIGGKLYKKYRVYDKPIS